MVKSLLDPVRSKLTDQIPALFLSPPAFRRRRPGRSWAAACEDIDESLIRQRGRGRRAEKLPAPIRGGAAGERRHAHVC